MATQTRDIPIQLSPARLSYAYPQVSCSHPAPSAREDIELPDPDLLGLHHALARLMHESGAGDVVDRVCGREPALGFEEVDVTAEEFERRFWAMGDREVGEGVGGLLVGT